MRCFDELNRLESLFGESSEGGNVRKGSATSESLLEVSMQQNPRIVPGTAEFQKELACIDTCVAYLTEHSRFRGAEEYIARFRKLQVHVLRRNCETVKKDLRAATQEISREIARMHGPDETKQSSASNKAGTDIDLSSLRDDTILYVKVRALGRELKPLILEIERRVHQAPYADMLLDLHRSFYENRAKILLPIARSRLTKLEADLGGQLPALARDASEYLQSMSIDEYQLFHEFFTPAATHREENKTVDRTTTVMTRLMRELCGGVYSMLRSRIIQQTDVDTLCELVQILVDVQVRARKRMEGFRQRRRQSSSEKDPDATLMTSSSVISGDSLSVFDAFLQRMIADTQERLVYRVEVYVEKNVRSFRPSRVDVDYPAKLLRLSDDDASAAKSVDAVSERGTLRRRKRTLTRRDFCIPR